MGERLLLIDGHSMAYRAYYALPVENFTTSSGQHTNAIYGFTNMLLALIKEEKPTHIAVAFDVSRKSFRTEKFPEYKANRSATPDEFRSQIPYLSQLLSAMKIMEYSLEGFEADDLIATIATDASAKGMEVLICSGDRDTFQLVRNDVTVLYPKRGVSDLARMTPDEVKNKYGLSPEQYPDFAALRGDPSDNLPSIPGVGEKTAAKWIIENESLENLLENAAAIPGKAGEALRANLAQIKLNHELTHLRRDVPIKYDLKELARNEFDNKALRNLFDQLEFKTLRDRIPSEKTEIQVEITLVKAEELSKIIDKTTGPIAISYDLLDERLNSYSVAFENGDSYLVMSDEVGPWLADSKIEKIIFDHKSLARTMDFEGLIFDVSLASYLVDPGNRLNSLSEVSERWLGIENNSAIALFELRKVLEPELAKRELTRLLLEIEQPISEILSSMERNGISIDKALLKNLEQEFSSEVARQTATAHKAAGHEFNVASPKQLQVVLFEELKLPKTKKIKTGYTTDADSLNWLFEETKHPVLEALLKIREISKLKSVAEGLIEAIKNDGKIHTHFQQTIAATGRLSSTEPNLQNIPIRTDAGKRIRTAFIPTKDFDSILTADYSQIELRIMAHLSNDEHLLNAFASGEDLHTSVGSLVFGVKPSEVTPDMRRQVKAMSYGLAYGLSAFGLSAQLDITPAAATSLMNTYYERFGGIRDYLQSVLVQARKDGYTETLLGRRRYLPDLQSDNRIRRETAERMALNAPMQGSAADIIKIAMIKVDNAIKEAKLKSRMLLQIHDELLFEIVDSEKEQLTEIIRTEMGQAYPLKAPLSVNIGIGKNWDSANH